MDFFIISIFIYIHALVVSYIIWAPLTPFKRGLMEGLTLKFIWGRWTK